MANYREDIDRAAAAMRAAATPASPANTYAARQAKVSNWLSAIAPAPGARRDGWYNNITSAGTSRDNRTASALTMTHVSDERAELLWRTDFLAARMVEAWPNEMLRQGFRLNVQDAKKDSEDISKRVAKHWSDLKLVEVLRRAVEFKRAYGGSAILMGVNDSRTIEKPLKAENANKLTFLNVFEPREVVPDGLYSDPLAPKYGEVEFWKVSPSQGSGAPSVRVHESRLIIFKGRRASNVEKHVVHSGFGDSIFTLVFSVLRDHNMTWDAAAVLVQNFSQAVMKIKGLAEAFEGDNDDLLKDRIQMQEMARSVLNVVLLDAEEEFARVGVNLTGLPDMLKEFNTRMAAAADMPLTLLMGTSPGGMNATGESDTRGYYDKVKAAQNKQLAGPIKQVTDVILGVENVKLEEYEIEFNPLWQPTDAEMAATRKTDAEADGIRIRDGVLLPEEVRQSRYGGPRYGTSIQLDDELYAKDKLEQEKIEAETREAMQAQLQEPDDEPDDELKPPTPDVAEPAEDDESS